MANRVILGSFAGTFVLRVSRPGFDVLTTTLAKENLAFDSRWNEGGNLYMKGSKALVAGNNDVLFGETLPNPPHVVAVYLFSGRWIHWNSTEAGFSNYMRSYPDKIQFPYPAGGSGHTVYYKVFRNFYG